MIQDSMAVFSVDIGFVIAAVLYGPKALYYVGSMSQRFWFTTDIDRGPAPSLIFVPLVSLRGSR